MPVSCGVASTAQLSVSERARPDRQPGSGNDPCLEMVQLFASQAARLGQVGLDAT